MLGFPVQRANILELQNITISDHSYKIMEQFRLEGTDRDHLVQSPSQSKTNFKIKPGYPEPFPVGF